MFIGLSAMEGISNNFGFSALFENYEEDLILNNNLKYFQSNPKSTIVITQSSTLIYVIEAIMVHSNTCN